MAIITKYSAFLIVSLLFLSFVMNYSIRYDYPLPHHSDEYDHLAVIQEMENTGKTVWYDPFIIQKRSAIRNLELDYDIFLYVFYALSGLKLEQIPLVVPIIISFLMSISAFVFVRLVTARPLAALFSAIMVFLLPNSIAFLGYWFLVPMAVGLASIPLIAYLFLKSIWSWRYTILLYAALIGLTLTHAVYTVIFLPAILLYFIFYPVHLRQNLSKVFIGFLILLGLTPWFDIKWDLANMPATFSEILSRLVWAYGEYTPFYPIFQYLGPITIFLFLLGAYFLFGDFLRRRGYISTLIPQKKSPILRPYMIFALLMPLTIFLIRFSSDFTNVCLLGPCRRTQPGLAIMLFMVAGIGAYAATKFLARILNLPAFAALGKLFRYLIVATVLMLFMGLLSTMPFIYATDSVRGLYKNIEPRDMPAILWIKDFTENPAPIMALPWSAKAVYVLAKEKVLDTGQARYGTPLELLKDISGFFTSNCSNQKATLDKYKPGLVYGGDGYIDCDALDLIYNKGGTYIYAPNQK